MKNNVKSSIEKNLDSVIVIPQSINATYSCSWKNKKKGLGKSFISFKVASFISENGLSYKLVFEGRSKVTMYCFTRAQTMILPPSKGTNRIEIDKKKGVFTQSFFHEATPVSLPLFFLTSHPAIVSLVFKGALLVGTEFNHGWFNFDRNYEIRWYKTRNMLEGYESKDYFCLARHSRNQLVFMKETMKMLLEMHPDMKEQEIICFCISLIGGVNIYRKNSPIYTFILVLLLLSIVLIIFYKS